MQKLLLLLVLSFFSAQSYAASCPDGNEPTKTVSADGSYFEYKCTNTVVTSLVTSVITPWSFNDPTHPEAKELLSDMEWELDMMGKYTDSIYPFDKQPVWTSNGLGPQSSDDREVIYLDEKFKVGRNETRVYENKVLHFKFKNKSQSSVDVSGNLIIKNSLIIWEQQYNQQNNLKVVSGGSLDINDSYAVSRGAVWWNWDYESGSTIRLSKFVSDVWTTALGSINYTAQNYTPVRLTLKNDIKNSVFNISNAPSVDLEIFVPVNQSMEVSLPPVDEWISFNLNAMYPNSKFEVTSSRIGRNDLTLSTGSKLTVHDSEDAQFGFIFDNTNKSYAKCELIDFGTPHTFPSNKVVDKTWDLGCLGISLRLINSKPTRAWFAMWGSMEMVVKNSNLVDPSNLGCGAKLYIYNSSIDVIRNKEMYCQKGAYTYLENTDVTESYDLAGSLSLIEIYHEKNPPSLKSNMFQYVDSAKSKLLNEDGTLYVGCEEGFIKKDGVCMVDDSPLFSEDFENGARVLDWSNKWSRKKANDGNFIYCNEASDDWTSFQFGNEDWSNYSISLRMKFPAGKGGNAETYIRINNSSEGYRVNINSFNGRSSIAFYPPYDFLDGAIVPIKKDEWMQIQLIFDGDNLKYLLDDEVVTEVNDDKRKNGMAGIGAAPNSEVCVDDIVVNKI